MHYFLFEDEIKYNLTNTPANTPDKLAHNGYELEYVFPNATKPLLLSEYFDNDVWQYMKAEIKKTPLQRMGIVRHLLENEVDLAVLAEAGDKSELTGLTCPLYQSSTNRYNTAVTRITGDVYFYGYWLNYGWFNCYRDIFLKEFSFRPITDPTNKQYESEIQSSLAIGVHVRRGDFIRIKGDIGEEYYHAAITQLYSNFPDATFFIFSDDLEWCKNNGEQMGFSGKKIVFIEGNYDYKNNYIDMQLMSMCDILVESNSSFCYLASLLNQTPGFQSLTGRPFPTDDLNGNIQRLENP